MSSRIWVGIAAAAVLLQPAFSQATGTGSTTTGTTSGGTATTGGGGSTRGRTLPTGNPGDPGTTPTNPNSGTSAPPPSIVVSGRVLLEDGTPPSTSTIIERVCNGSPHAEGYTDAKGYFVLTLGQNRGTIMDASETQGDFGMGRGGPQGLGTTSGGTGGGTSTARPMMDSRYSNCDIRARLPGYRSQSVSLVDHHAMDNPDIGVILMHRLGPAESATVDATSLAAPKNAHKAYTKGLEFIKKQQPDDARKSFESAVQQYPAYATAWLELGKLQVAKGDLEQAYNSFSAASKAEPRMVAPYLELALLAAHAKNWTELADVTDHALKLDSFDYPQAFFLNAVANYNLHNTDQAEKSARTAKRLDTRHEYPQAVHLLGEILLQRRDYPAAADELRDYLVMAPRAPDSTMVRKQLGELERVVPAAQVAKKDQ